MLRMMSEDQLRALLEDVRAGSTGIDDALARVRHLPFEDLGFAKVDHHRALRHGMPEVVFGLGKTPGQIVAIADALLERSENVLITRATPEAAQLVLEAFPHGEHFPMSGAIRFWRNRELTGKGKIAVVCAGTSDIFVAETSASILVQAHFCDDFVIIIENYPLFPLSLNGGFEMTVFPLKVEKSCAPRDWTERRCEEILAKIAEGH